MKAALIISLQYRVAHVAHLLASYRQMTDLGYDAQILVHPDMIKFFPEGINIITDYSAVRRPSVAIFWFPAKANFNMMRKLKKDHNTKILYVFHEPLESYNIYKQAGITFKEYLTIAAKYLASLVLVRLSDGVIVPSKKAYNLFEKSLGKKFNSRYSYLPLLFDDTSCEEEYKRNYFSYIGTIAKDHAYEEFLSFMHQALEDKDWTPSLSFLIATRNKVVLTDKMKMAIRDGHLKIIDGHPLTEDEINRCYASSICVWNAYHRTTQSGVLAKASMFGTPALVLRKNLSEFSIEGKNVVCCNDNSNYEEIKDAIIKLLSNFSGYSKAAEKMFKETFYYKSQNTRMRDILSLTLREN